MTTGLSTTPHSLADAIPPTTVDASGNFQFRVPVVAFEKGDAPEGQRRRIAGIISTDSLDQQQERVIQEGLDFSGYIKSGFLNWNHSNKSASDILGYPESVKQFKRGEMLPNGESAQANCSWNEGYLIGRQGQDVWEMAKDLQGTPRSLGFSIEGTINKRDEQDPSTILSASVNAVAITSCPVNQDSRLEILARSLAPQMDIAPAKSKPEPQPTAKAYTMSQGPGGDPSLAATGIPTPNVPITGEGTGQAFTVQFGAVKRRLLRRKRSKLRKQATRKSQSVALPDAPISLNRQEAIDFLQKAVPGLSSETARQVFLTARAMSAAGL
jgi:hypothetical protein